MISNLSYEALIHSIMISNLSYEALKACANMLTKSFD